MFKKEQLIELMRMKMKGQLMVGMPSMPDVPVESPPKSLSNPVEPKPAQLPSEPAMQTEGLDAVFGEVFGA